MPTPFCPHCSAYLPAGAECPACKQARSALEITAAPGQPLWQVQLPGQPAQVLAATTVDGEPVLLAGWGHTPQASDLRPEDGGVVALRRADGSLLWSQSLGAPVLGGVAANADVVVAGFGDAVAALNAGSGDVLWRTPLGAAVRSVPVLAERRVLITAGDGCLHCLNLADGKPVSGWPVQVYPRPVPIPAPPLLLDRKGVPEVVVVATNGSRFGREPGLIAAFSHAGKLLWEQPAGGYVRGSPVADRDRLFVAAHSYNSGEGVLSVLHTRTGEPLWPAPFRLEPEDAGGHHHDLVAAPLVHDHVVYVGSLDHKLYALEARSGRLLWQAEAPGGLVTSPLWVEGLVVVGGNDGSLVAFDPQTQQLAWVHGMDTPVLTTPLAVDGVVFAAAQDGRVVALPWHLGKYAWAAERLQVAGRWSEAGDAWALSGHYSGAHDERIEAYTRATAAWVRGGRPDKVAFFWLALGRKQDAAAAFQAAGELWRLHERRQAAWAFWAAHGLYWPQRSAVLLQPCLDGLIQCADLPSLSVRPANVRRFIIGEPGSLHLRLVNQGTSELPGSISLWLGGSLAEPVEAEINAPMPAGATWNVPISLVPTQEESTLVVEYTYHTSDSAYPRLQGLLEIAIEAKAPRQKPLEFGDVQNLVIRFESTTKEGIAIETRDVAMMRNEGDIGSISAEGDIAAIIARRGNIGPIHVDGDTGLIAGRDQPLSPLDRKP